MSIRVDGKTTLGSLAADYPALIPWFLEKDWDFCCGGNRALAEVAGDDPNGLAESIATITSLIRTLPDTGTAPLPAFAERQPAPLISYILERFHEPHRQIFPGLRQMAEKVRDVHGDRHPWLADLKSHVGKLIDDLVGHMLREEQVLFPMTLNLGTERAAHFGCSGGNPTMPIKVMRTEHEDAADLMERIVLMTSRFTPPQDACATFRAYFRSLADLDRELRLHMHLENNVLFPMIAAEYADLES
jgi:regulator of cell morphogenesis and NO signaling